MPHNNSTVFCVENGTLEWEEMWLMLSNIELNNGDNECLCPLSGESWQYMYSTNERGHEFRHRSHPNKNNESIVLYIPINKRVF